ncbi:hypothetical protein [Zhihengliuella salsuginis]|uniref:WXG100 family type VII secretion target n=1 Tax=Zhihengliuella salsuginis TaxID=578222 RepID=A0ABQ3GBW2_9MICC|nr:hypothetical protein [Zhihengliuella salsuginis]GHC99803.1 hypothetical protein GCM10008096_02340 [Zhihengliuella salsuginis]
MSEFNTAQLYQWEQPSLLQADAEQIRTAATSFAASIENGHATWQGLQQSYQDASAGSLHTALDTPLRKAEAIHDAGGRTAETLESLADDIQACVDVRDTLVTRIRAFEADRAATFGTPNDYQAGVHDAANFMQEIADLQDRYLVAIQICVARLNDIAGETTSLTEPWLTPTHPLHLTKEAFVAGGTALRTATSTTMASDEAGKFWLRPRDRAAVGDSNIGPGFWGDQKDILAKQTKNLIDSPSTGIFDNTKDFKEGLKRGALGAMPIAGEVNALRGRPQTTEATAKIGDKTFTTTITRDNSKSTKLGQFGIRGLASAGTLLGIKLTYDTERDYRITELAAEHPTLSADAIRAEARHDAAAQAVGQAGANVGASAAAGAAAGSVIPGPGTLAGTIVGAVVGIGSGVLVNAKVADGDGDGEKGSVASATGDLIQEGWRKVRGSDF